MIKAHRAVVSGCNQNFMCLVEWVQPRNNGVCLYNNCSAIAQYMDAKCIESWGSVFWCSVAVWGNEKRGGVDFFFFFFWNEVNQSDVGVVKWGKVVLLKGPKGLEMVKMHPSSGTVMYWFDTKWLGGRFVIMKWGGDRRENWRISYILLHT